MALVMVTSKNFEGEVLTAGDDVVLVDFWAEWCAPCQLLTPIMDEISQEHSGVVKVCKVNVDDSPELADRFQIFSIPTVLFFHKGKLMDRIIGYVPKRIFLKKVNEVLGQASRA